MDSLARVEALAGHLLDFADVRRPPTPLSLIHAVADVRLLYVDWRYHHGLTHRRRGVFYIAVNANDVEDERRFTVFHELFHVIERVQPVFRLAAPAEWHGELLADHFALSILLNERWLPACLRACAGDMVAVGAECGASPALVRSALTRRPVR